MRLAMHRGKYVVYSNQGGKTQRLSLGTTDRLTAERRLADYLAQLKTAEASKGFTIAQLWDRRQEALGSRVTALNMKYAGRSILPFFGHYSPHQLTAELCHEYTIQKTAQGQSQGTIHTHLGKLRDTLSWAKKLHLIETSHEVPRPPAPPPKSGYLTKAEARVLLEAAREPHHRLFIILALATGARRQALLELTWDRVDLDRRLIHLATDDTTHKKGRSTVPINQFLHDALATTVRVGTHVLNWRGKPVQNINNAIKTIATRAGLGFVSPHVFRHSAAVWMAEDGVSMSEIAQYLGHTNTSVTERVYARYSPTYLRKAAQALEL